MDFHLKLRDIGRCKCSRGHLRRIVGPLNSLSKFLKLLDDVLLERAKEYTAVPIVVFDFVFFCASASTSQLSGSEGGCKIELLQSDKLLKYLLKPIIYNSFTTFIYRVGLKARCLPAFLIPKMPCFH